MSRMSKRNAKNVSIRLNNKKIKGKAEKNQFSQKQQHSAEVSRLMEKYGLDKHISNNPNGKSIW